LKISVLNFQTECFVMKRVINSKTFESYIYIYIYISFILSILRKERSSRKYFIVKRVPHKKN
jgi:hypothetical protein